MPTNKPEKPPFWAPWMFFAICIFGVALDSWILVVLSMGACSYCLYNAMLCIENLTNDQ